MALSMAISISANAQLSLSSQQPTISEDFNSMWSSSGVSLTLPDGWKIDKNISAPRLVSEWDKAEESVMYTNSESLSSNQSNGTYCFGATADNSDRAIGGLTTSVANGTRGISLMTRLTNSDPAKIITNLKLDYNIEKYRNGSNPSGFSVRIFTSTDGKRWTESEENITSFEPDLETIGEPVVPISTKEVNNQNLRIHVEPQKDIYVAWNISVTDGTACNLAPGYAIDDINITATFADSDDEWEEEELPDFNPSGYYLRGELNGWAATQDWEFSKVSETEYELYNKTISGAFKVADSTWTDACNFGSNGGNITMGEPYEMVYKTDTNISCGSMSFPCAKIVLKKDGNTASLTLYPNVSTKGLTTVYMVGDFNNWNYMDTSGKLTLDPSDNLFKGQVGLTPGQDGLSRWMIYQRLALAGAWGLDNNSTVAGDKGTLTAGETGHVASEPGMYDVTFNLETGEYTLTVMPSVAQSIELTPEKAILVPQLPDKVKVLSLNNSLIHYNDQAKVFNDIASSKGKDAVWTKHTNLGKSLQYHWDEGDGMTDAGEPGAKMMIRSDAWSHIILQEQTTLPRTSFNDFRNSVKQWVEYIRDNCPNPNAVVILPLNWALGQDWTNFTNFNEILLENYNKVAQEFGVVICPVGLAYQSKFDKDGGTVTEKDWFLPGDDRHPTLKATYLAALMEYSIIFDEDPTSVTYYPNYTTDYDKVGEMSDAIAAEMKQYAKNALDSYTNVVNHHEGTVNLKGVVLDQFNLEMPDENITWTVTPSNAVLTDGVFSCTENGEYTVTATSGQLSAKATIIVANAETEVPQIDFISLSESNLEYTQNFNSMGDAEEATIPDGWRADGQLTERTIGTFRAAPQTTIKSGGAGFGATAKNGVWNLGDSSDPTDRALGGITTDTQGGAKSINIYAAFKNDGKKYLSSFDISYDVEKYRDGSNGAGFTVQLYTSVDGRNWKSAGDNFATRFEPSASTAGSAVVPMETRHNSATLEFDMAPGAELYLAWNISASTGTSCQAAPVLAIDNVDILANLRPVPEFDYYIYIENQAGYEKTALYAWSDNTPSEIFGGWPGQNPIDVIEFEGVTYDVFGHNQATGNYNLIYNNNNNGSQHTDYKVPAGQHHYLRAKADGNLEAVVNSGVDTVLDDLNFPGISFSANNIFCKGASMLTVFNSAGMKMAAAAGESIDLNEIPSGIYIVQATVDGKVISRKFLKR